ncbi:MAG: hypothetical protein ROZ37_02240 [Aromatoleum sp.]|jgi:hypothetical protein|uniref:hypothetical protein n=1 Tax=Aromatoleum sp. TaxID=2307007 RepID=UPI002893D4A2|nr:hypothetical protein [Aromatoleum sp.]MDT3669133.1 hypothetical protein [Aromatoleum sp.]
MSELFFSSPVKRCAVLAASTACTALPLSSQATLITFDDLRSETAVTTQYEDQGLIVRNGVIRRAEFGDKAVVSPPNVLYDLFGPGLTLQFVGTLPTTVSMFVTALLEDRIFLTAWSETEVLDRFETEGWRGLEELSTAAIPRQPVTLIGTGISRIELESFYFRRGDINIDDLSFSTTAIDEPSTILLAALGLVAVLPLGRLRRSAARERSTPHSAAAAA